VSIRVHVHKTHQQFTSGMEMVETEGMTVGDCLKDLVRKFPAMSEKVFKNGKLNPLMEVYLNAQSAYPNELARPVKDGDQIHLTLMLSGG
jgi:molybdopterin converting factor small subunit